MPGAGWTGPNIASGFAWFPLCSSGKTDKAGPCCFSPADGRLREKFKLPAHRQVPGQTFLLGPSGEFMEASRVY